MKLARIYKWLRCGLAFRPTFFFTTAPVFAQDTGSVGRQPPCLVPPVLRRPPLLKPVCTPCPRTAPCLECCLQHLSCISTFVLLAMPKVDNLAKGWIGSVGIKTGAAMVHAAKMPTQCILTRESMQVQCDGTMADVKMLPAFTTKRSPGCFSDVLHDILEGNLDLQLVVVRPSGKDLEHLFEYAQATMDGDGRQETVYLENLDDHGCPNLQADGPQGASRKNTSWQAPLRHRLCLSMEKDPSLSSPVNSLRNDLPHQWSEHGPGTTSAALWVNHKDKTPLPSPLYHHHYLLACPTSVSRGQTVPHRWRHMARTQIDASHTFSQTNPSTSSTSYDKRSGRPATSFTGRPSRRSPLIRIFSLRTCLVSRPRK